ncbi:hypothetical protein LSTR_LSTR007436 [Laodelphax striatellus]|uniref:Uncharacterized protein n=1 Tax=Laodelphax striatellus TaxID=195883 RepID=A0A482X3P4_LAOST|nr:hypothetical protein LSTR_LSTR007436 [Laodelphax striatellus]
MIALILISAALIASASAGYLDHSSAYGYATAPAVDLTYGYGTPTYGASTYGAPTYGAPAYGTPTYGAPPTYGAAPIVKAYAPTATSYSNTYHIAKSVPVAAAPIYKASPLAAYGAAYGAPPTYGVPAYGAPAAAYGPAPAYGPSYYGSGYGYLH